MTEVSPRLRLVFWALVLVGLAERFAAAHYSNLGIEHPDEHQQYLEQAYRRCHDGYGYAFWEQDRGMRHLLYSDTLALFLRSFDGLGIHDAFTQATLLRCIVAGLVFGVLALTAWLWLRSGHTAAAFFLLFLQVVSIDVIYIQVRLLTENAMAVPLVLGMLLERRHPRLAGLCWAIMFAVRFQSAFLIAGFGLWSLGADWQVWRGGESWWRAFAPTRRLAEGLLLGLMFVGWYDTRYEVWYDLRTYERWFHSPIEYVRANVLEDKASQFGVQPWYTYLVHSTRNLLLMSPIFLFMLLPIAKSQARLFFVAGMYVLAHSLVGHKELRFMWGVAPIGMILLSLGFESLYAKWQNEPGMGGHRRVPRACVLVGLSFVLPSLVRLSLPLWYPITEETWTAIQWQREPYRTTCLALARVGQQNDARGVLMWGFYDWESGNCFYLRRPPNVFPHYVNPDSATLVQKDGAIDWSEWPTNKVNYVVIPRDRLAFTPAQTWTKVGDAGKASVFRVDD
jgi:hypothetical protein